MSSISRAPDVLEKQKPSPANAPLGKQEEDTGVCAWWEARGALLPAPPGLLTSLWIRVPLISTYLTARDTPGSGAAAESSGGSGSGLGRIRERQSRL